MTTNAPIDRLKDAINSHDPRRVADCFTTDYRSETPHRPQGRAVWCGCCGTRS
ncbi:hypothetical protein CFP65_2007 [Kitasatospora sp. MMS16-BH015]|nr:hypothetical protein CFP65_2007 [Kitasatospora sp. MMS16-BH015]